jgi:hypothetical protein
MSVDSHWLFDSRGLPSQYSGAIESKPKTITGNLFA